MCAQPIISEEFVLMEHLTRTDVVVVCGETGSGKTTQVGVSVCACKD
jgi:HrpA-like RNA helicase